MANVLVISLDFDGCMDTLKAREWLTQWLIDYLLEHPEMTVLEFQLNTARQFVSQDYLMSNVHGKFHKKLFSCAYLEKSFMPQFKVRLAEAFKEVRRTPPVVQFEPLLAGDLYNNLKPGTSLSNMDERLYLNWNIRRKQGDEVRFTVQDLDDQDVVLYQSGDQCDYYATKNFKDASKLLTMYMHWHNMVARDDSDNTYHIKMLDDRPDILQPLNARLYSVPALIPQNCTLQVVHCCLDKGARHNIPSALKTFDFKEREIRGTGRVNLTYQADIRWVIEQIQKAPRTTKFPDVGKIFQLLAQRTTGQLVAPDGFFGASFVKTFFDNLAALDIEREELVGSYILERC